MLPLKKCSYEKHMKVIHVPVQISLHLLTCNSSNHLGFRLGFPNQSKFQIQTILFNIKEWKKNTQKNRSNSKAVMIPLHSLFIMKVEVVFSNILINHFEYKSILTSLKSSHQMWFKDILQQYVYKTSAHLRTNRSF